jgi:hypothetical protein
MSIRQASGFPRTIGKASAAERLEVSLSVRQSFHAAAGMHPVLLLAPEWTPSVHALSVSLQNVRSGNEVPTLLHALFMSAEGRNDEHVRP